VNYIFFAIDFSFPFPSLGQFQPYSFALAGNDKYDPAPTIEYPQGFSCYIRIAFAVYIPVFLATVTSKGAVN